jgi:hypothetical protein
MRQEMSKILVENTKGIRVLVRLKHIRKDTKAQRNMAVSEHSHEP